VELRGSIVKLEGKLSSKVVEEEDEELISRDNW